MKNNPLVSIITVVYNGAATIEQTIKSVLGQTYENIEYIIIDGKSTDSTYDIIREYIPLFQGRLKYTSEKDDGLYFAMNKGICQASGDLIGIINSDDWYLENSVEIAVKSFEAEPSTDVVYGNLMYLKKDGLLDLITPSPIEDIWISMTIPHPTVFVKKHIYNKYGLFNVDYNLAADYELLLRLYSNNVQFKYINETLAYFREGGISQRKRYECIQESFEIAYKHIGKCPNKEHILPIIRDNRGMFMLKNILKNDPYKVINMIEDNFGTIINELVIFGTGYWGNECCNGILNTGVQILYFVDNNTDKRKFHNISIKRPDDITGDKYILIAVKNNSDDIEKQLKNMGIIRYVTINKLIDKYILADH